MINYYFSALSSPKEEMSLSRQVMSNIYDFGVN